MGDASEENERKEHYRTAEDFAKRCIALDSTCSDGYAWLAAGLGNEAVDAGGRRKVQLANEIKRCLDRAVALDSTNDIAWSILGTFYRVLGGVSWIERQLANLLLGSLPEGGYAESEQAFHRAIAISPRAMRHRFELALLYEAMDRIDEARTEYAACASLQPQMISDRRRQAEADKWVRENPEHSADKK
jgi:tetratricopeptide (TPR) repeat protein